MGLAVDGRTAGVHPDRAPSEGGRRARRVRVRVLRRRSVTAALGWSAVSAPLGCLNPTPVGRSQTSRKFPPNGPNEGPGWVVLHGQRDLAVRHRSPGGVVQRGLSCCPRQRAGRPPAEPRLYSAPCAAGSASSPCSQGSPAPDTRGRPGHALRCPSNAASKHSAPRQHGPCRRRAGGFAPDRPGEPAGATAILGGSWQR